eukprot:764437-Hanusia_phi.AAC.2
MTTQPAPRGAFDRLFSSRVRMRDWPEDLQENTGVVFSPSSSLAVEGDADRLPLARLHGDAREGPAAASATDASSAGPHLCCDSVARRLLARTGGRSRTSVPCPASARLSLTCSTLRRMRTLVSAKLVSPSSKQQVQVAARLLRCSSALSHSSLPSPSSASPARKIRWRRRRRRRLP